MKLQEKINIYLVTKPLFSHVILFMFIFMQINSIYYIFFGQDMSIIVKSFFVLLAIFIMYKSTAYIKKKVQSIINYLYESARCDYLHKKKAIILLISLIIISIYYLIDLGLILMTLSKYIFAKKTIINELINKDSLEYGQNCIIFLCEKYNLSIKKEYFKIILLHMDYLTIQEKNLTFISFLENEIKIQKYLEYSFLVGLTLVISIYFASSAMLNERIIRRITVLRIYCLLLLLNFMSITNLWFWLNIIIFKSTSQIFLFSCMINSTIQIFLFFCMFLPILLLLAEYTDHRKQKGKNYFNLFYWIFFICLLYLYFYFVYIFI